MHRKTLELSSINNLSNGSFMNYTTFSLIYPFIYFDLTEQENLLGNYPLALRYALSAPPGSATKLPVLFVTTRLRFDFFAGSHCADAQK